jgi:hypothetical protein
MRTYTSDLAELRSAILHPWLRVDGVLTHAVAEEHLVVEVRPGAVAGGADAADGLADDDWVADADPGFGL